MTRERVTVNHEPPGPPLRGRVLTSIVFITARTVILFVLPLGIAVQRLYRTEMVTARQRNRSGTLARHSPEERLTDAHAVD